METSAPYQKEMKRIKVLHLVEELKVGGLERVIADIACGLNREKYDVEVWCIVQGGKIADELRNKGMAIRILGIRTYHNPFNILKLHFLLEKTRPDIVHTHGYFAAVIGRIAARTGGVPVIVTHLHTLFYNLTLRNVIIDRVLNLFTHKIICVSEAVRTSFIRAGYRMKRSIVIYNGIDGKKYKCVAGRPGVQKKVIATVASLYSHKGHTYLLKAMKRVLMDFPEVRLWIIGDGPLRQGLEKEAVDLGIPSRIFFLGKRKDIPELLSQSDIFVLASLREGLPLALIEAIASGLPVVATNVGGIPEVVADGETGLLVPPEDPGALAEAIVNLLKKPRMMEEMGQKGLRVFREKFTREIMLARLENLYGELIKNYCENNRGLR